MHFVGDVAISIHVIHFLKHRKAHCNLLNATYARIQLAAVPAAYGHCS